MKGEAEMEYLEMIVDFAKSILEQWDSIEDVVIRVIDFVENVGMGIVG